MISQPDHITMFTENLETSYHTSIEMDLFNYEFDDKVLKNKNVTASGNKQKFDKIM